MNKLGFIGAGNLTSSILKGLNQRELKFKIYIYDLLDEKINTLVKAYNNVSSASLAEVVQESQILILAVKPKDIISLLSELSQYDLKEKLVVAVAAGIGLDVYEKHLPGIGIIRVMPNTSSAVLHSITGLVRGKYVKDNQAEIVGELFSALGKVLWLEDSKMNALTAVSGSGPAYFYLIAELMSQAGVMLGLDRDEAELLAKETLIGAGKMLEQSSKTPSQLREAVTSPNGTTEAAINSFLEHDLDKVIYEAMLACRQRAEKMEGEYS